MKRPQTISRDRIIKLKKNEKLLSLHCESVFIISLSKIQRLSNSITQTTSMQNQEDLSRVWGTAG